MKEKRKKIMAPAVVFLLSMLFYHAATNIITSFSSPTPTVHVQSVRQPICATFNISITITDVTDLGSFSFYLSYNSSLLEVVNASDGGFLAGGRFKYSSTAGDLYAMSSGPPASVSGSGTLAVATFHCINEGESRLTLHDVQLRDSQDRQIQANTENGTCKQETMFWEPLYLDHNYTLCSDMSSSGSLFKVNASNVVIDLNGHSVTCIGTLGAAVQIIGMSNVSIMNGALIRFQKGVTMDRCTNVRIINTKVLSSYITGIEVTRSNYTQIVDTEISGQTSGEAICLDKSNCVNISNNTISNNYGAILMSSSNNNTISKNQIASSSYEGIDMSNCFNNTFWSNDFIQNAKQVMSFASANNTWDLGYLFGNYWDDYASQSIVDNGSGQNHTLGSDGIGDTPYIIDQNNTDNYPLMNPHGQKLQMFEAEGHALAIFSDAYISAFDFNQTACQKISFNVTGGTFCKAIIPNKLIDGAIETQVDGTPVASLSSWDDSYTFTNVTYKSAHQIRIGGEYVCKIREDLNGDGKVNIIDVTIVARAYKP